MWRYRGRAVLLPSHRSIFPARQLLISSCKVGQADRHLHRQSGADCGAARRAASAIFHRPYSETAPSAKRANRHAAARLPIWPRSSCIAVLRFLRHILNRFGFKAQFVHNGAAVLAVAGAWFGQRRRRHRQTEPAASAPSACRYFRSHRFPMRQWLELAHWRLPYGAFRMACWEYQPRSNTLITCVVTILRAPAFSTFIISPNASCVRALWRSAHLPSILRGQSASKSLPNVGRSMPCRQSTHLWC